jgi:hypothetical protein
LSDAADDVFARIESRFVELSGLLERMRRYRPLAASAAELVRASSRLSAEVRAALRAGDAGGAEPLESRATTLATDANARLEAVVGSADYRALAEAVVAADVAAAAALAARVFADVEPADSVSRIYQPLTAKRGESGVEPEAGIGRLRALREEGLEPTPGPGVGGDETIRPIRFYEGTEGLDVAVLLEVEGEALGLPLFRASGLGEILVYAPRVRVPFRVAVRLESPDDWLEARPGGYARYRARWLEALATAELPAVDV